MVRIRGLGAVSAGIFSGAAIANAADGGSRHQALRMPGGPIQDALVKPLTVDQELFICNAYPSASPIAAQMDGKSLLTAAGEDPIKFRECRSIAGTFKEGDRLELSLVNAEIHSTFAVGSLSLADAQLFLVPYKKPGSPLIRFQSFALSKKDDGKDAQLALLDTFSSSNLTVSRANGERRLRMEQEEPSVPMRTEEIAFDQVYSVVAGVYVASIDGLVPREVNLLKDQSYVAIRTGDDAAGYPESLVIFPESPLPVRRQAKIVHPPPPVQGFFERMFSHIFSRF